MSSAAQRNELPVVVRFVVLLLGVATVLCIVLYGDVFVESSALRPSLAPSGRPSPDFASSIPSVQPSVGLTRSPTAKPSRLVQQTVTLHLPAHADDSRVMEQRVLMFSAMNEQFQEVYTEYVLSNQRYCARHGYPFLDSDNQTGIHLLPDREMRTPHFSRIYAGINILAGLSRYSGPPLDWIAYLDADAVVAEPALPLQLFIKLAQERARHFENGSSSQCEFIAQDSPHIVNSGFWLVRNSTWGLGFLRTWLLESAKERQDSFHWMADQGPLMNTILLIASATRNGSYADECRRHIPRDVHWANSCWKSAMSKLGLGFEHRMVGPICLLGPGRGAPWRMHVHGDYQPGDFVRHQKGLSREQLALAPTISLDVSSWTLNRTVLVAEVE